ncbi:MAG: M48 family metallopeptidase [Cyanobacteria bacterium P01_D01_bin.105]
MSDYVPKEIIEEVNTTPVHPLVNMGNLLATVAVVGLLVYGSLGFVASQLVVHIEPQAEEKIGQALTAAFPVKTAEDDSRVTYLTSLLESLELNMSEGQNARPYPPLKVRILLTPEENAMVTAGSYLFVTDGLLAAVESENELAFVLAHELGHLHHRDPLKAMGRSLVFVTINAALGIGQSNSALPSVINLAELSYSRRQEIAADDYAIAQIIRRYGHGGESLEFFERNRAFEMGGAIGEVFGTVSEWQQTHPLSSDRIERLDNQFEENSWEKTGEATPLPKFIECPNFECPN